MEDWAELEKELRSKLIPKQVSEDGKMITYQTIQYEGSIGNTEYWTDEDWRLHREYVKRLEENGTYLKPWICEMTLQYSPLFDESTFKDTKGSYSYTVIDFSKENQEFNRIIKNNYDKEKSRY